ncbi:hypothetical protein B0H13DRAFT_2535003 [Mycena leptocephala]|nr:hypothetical protein B0H13DRAFT_2535003 [Mycena leptocephala]
MARNGKHTPTASTHSKRNPAKVVQPTRKRASKKSGNASRATDALKAAERLRDRINMDADVTAFYDYKDTLIKSLAVKYNRTVTHFRKLLSNGTQYSTTRGVSLWNAIIHDRSLKAKEAGEPSDLKTMRADFSREEYEEMKATMSDEEKKRLLKQLRDHRELKQRGIRSTNRAAAADAMQNSNRVGDVLMDLYERTGVRSIALFTRGHPDDPSVPNVVDSDETRSFFQEALGVPILDVLRLLEQWSCTRDKAAKNDRNTVQKELAEVLSAGLRKIKNNKATSMVYTNYREEIVHKLGVELAGWPSDIDMQRPSKMPAEHARSILDKLRSGAICWVALTRGQRDKVAEEMDALRAKGELKQRKERSDKGRKRGPHADDEDDDESDDEGENSSNSSNSDNDEDSSSAPTIANSTAAPTGVNPSHTASSTPAATDANLAHAMATPLPAENTPLNGAVLSGPLFDFDNIDWDLPQYYDGMSAPAFAAVGMPPLPNSFRSESGGDDYEFPLALSIAPTEGTSSTMGGGSAVTAALSARTNLVDGGRKRKSGEDVESAREPKKARKERSDKGKAHHSGVKDNGGLGEGGNATDSASTPTTNSAAPAKPRKKRSDAGKHRGESTGAENAATPAPARQRKKRSDAGTKRGPRH